MSGLPTPPAAPAARARPDLSTYDSYIQWFATLVGLVQGVVGAPLEEMLAANVRMSITGARVLVGNTVEHVDPADLARQRDFLEKLIAFRNTIAKNREATGT